MATLLLALVIGTCVPGFQTAKPDFSGTWIIQPPNKVAGTERVVKQDAKTISITTVSAKGSSTSAYQLDGVEHRESRPTRGGDIVMVSKAEWVGKTLALTVAISYPNKMKTLAKEIWSIDATGQFVVDFTETAEGDPPLKMIVVHKKKS